MKLLLLTSVILAFLGSAYSLSGITIETHDLKFDENAMSLDVNIKRKSDRIIINVKGEIFEDINEPIYVHAAMFERGDDGEYKHLANVSINACNILQRLQSKPIIRAIIKEFLKASNFPLECPYKRGVYHIKDMVLDDNLIPPFVQPFIPPGNFMQQIRISRIIDDMDVTLMRMRLVVDINPARMGRSVRLF